VGLEQEVRLRVPREEALRVAHGRTGRRRVGGHIHLFVASESARGEVDGQCPIPIWIPQNAATPAEMSDPHRDMLMVLCKR